VAAATPADAAPVTTDGLVNVTVTVSDNLNNNSIL
jgi:hypothetical protein